MDFETAMKLLIENELRMHDTINMVPSENYASLMCRLPLITDGYNRYFFNNSLSMDSWNFRGAEDIGVIETQMAVPILKELSAAKYVNVKPLSGLNCMALVLQAYKRCDCNRMLSIAPELGGHYATKDLANSFGYKVDFITGTDGDNIDFDKLKVLLKSNNYNLAYLEQSNCLFPIKLSELINTIHQNAPNTIVHVDSSHWMGFILGGVMENPLSSGADSFGGSTHKTFPGPQHALICTNNAELIKRVEDSQYYMISSHHFGAAMSLALSLWEFKNTGGAQYAKLLVENAKALASELDKIGFTVEGKQRGFTEGHQIWAATESLGVNTYLASQLLYDSNMRVNVLDDIPNMDGWTLRLGTNEITRAGAVPSDMVELAQIMKAAVTQNTSTAAIRNTVKDFKASLIPTYGIRCKDGLYAEYIQKLCNISEY